MCSARQCLGVFAAVLVCQRAMATPPLPDGHEVLSYGHEVIQLYESGKVQQAREALLKLVSRKIASAQRVEGSGPKALQTRLSLYQDTWLIARCLDLEDEFGPPGSVPAELIEATDRNLAALDRAVEHAQRAESTDVHVQVALSSAAGSKARLISRLVIAFRRVGDEASAQRVAKQYAAFLAERGIDSAALQPQAARPMSGGAGSWLTLVGLLVMAAVVLGVPLVVLLRRTKA